MVPDIRIQKSNGQAVREDGDFILYWMIAHRRVNWNFSLDRAIEWAQRLEKPLVILEALRCDYHWASDRLHRFILQGMAENARRLKSRNIVYYPFVELKKGNGRGLLVELGKYACVIVTDDFPSFFLPRMIQKTASRLPVLLEKVDSNGLLPMRAANKVFQRAYDFRRFLQKDLANHLIEFPNQDPLEDLSLPRMDSVPKGIVKRWPMASSELLDADTRILSGLKIDHSVSPAPIQGGSSAAESVLQQFVEKILPHYAEERNKPEEEATSGLSPYLHFGHISAHQVFAEIMRYEDWSLSRISPIANGSRSGWWGAGTNAEAFLDQLITWRELGYNMCWQQNDYDSFESLPDWALKTLSEHIDDRRQYVYSLKEFEQAETHDLLWNAAQIQLVREGRIHNYLRMLWGKKILEWTRDPRDALAIMIELNNKYALDGRNPNSYSGIFWVLGRYDRAWGPERPIFGKVRYMSSENTARKFAVKNYIARYT